VRVVQLSRRLRALLREHFLATGRPGPEALVLDPPIKHHTFRPVTWTRVLERAQVGHVRPKDLRSSFASHLLSAGVPAHDRAAQRHAGHDTDSHAARPRALDRAAAR
jgi:integrase